MNEEAKVIYDAGLADGRRLGVQDKVSQDHARWRAVFGLVMTELHAIVRGEHHTCTQTGPLAPTIETEGRCLLCHLLACCTDAGVAEFIRVQQNLKDAGLEGYGG